MVNAAYKLLKTVQFLSVSTWSANLGNSNKFNPAYPLLPLRKVLTRAKDVIQVQDETIYRRITIRLYGQGIHLRDEVYGSEIGTKRQFIAKAGQLAISRIDARNGAFGIVPSELTGAIVTNDFWLFEIEGASNEYLMLLLSSPSFQPYWQGKSSGTTNRQRVDEQGFLNTRVPIPNRGIQDQIVQAYKSIIAEAEQYKRIADELESSIDTIFFEYLKIEKIAANESSNCFMKTYKMSELARWDAWNRKEPYKSTVYPFVNFERIVCGKPLYGANEKAINVRTDVRYIRITDINENGSLNDDFVSALKVEDKYLLQNNDFLIARSGNTVGKTFLYKEHIGKAVFAGYLVKYILNTEKVIPEYVLYYSKSKMFKAWIESNKRIFGQPNINGQEYLSSQFIIPPIDVQARIVSQITVIKDKAKALRQKAESLLQHAKKQFEEAVFGE